MNFHDGEVLNKDKAQSFKLILENQIFIFWKSKGESYGVYLSKEKISKIELETILSSDSSVEMLKVIYPKSFEALIQDSFSNFSKVKFIPRKSLNFEIIFHAVDGRLFVADLDNVQTESVVQMSPRSNDIKVMIIDDSPTIQNLLEKTFESSSGYKVVCKAKLPSEVEALIKKNQPDVITLDLHMPEMNGVELYNSVIKRYEIPTIIISSVSIQEGPLVIEALNSGAIDYIQKPTLKELPSLKPMILEKVTTAFESKKSVHNLQYEQQKVLLDCQFNENSLVVIGSSTGGVQALEKFICALPDRIPPIGIVQHIPEVFSKALADRLNTLTPLTVKEAEDQEVMKENCIYIAPGGKQMALKKKGKQKLLVISDDPPVNNFKPSVDFFFSSVAQHESNDVVSVIFTGMGKDGAQGMKLLKSRGAITIAQDEETSAVFGMPKAAIKLGCVDHILPLQQIASGVCKAVNRQFSKKKAV